MQKCEFLQKEVECLGFHISNKGIHPAKNKVEVLLQMSPPTTRKELKRFLGMFNHYKRLYHATDLNLEILCNLTSPNKSFRWTLESQKNFDRIKETTMLDTLLVLPDFNKPFYIDSDSSNFQLGSIIYQDHGIIAHHSRSLTEHQQRFTTPEK